MFRAGPLLTRAVRGSQQSRSLIRHRPFSLTRSPVNRTLRSIFPRDKAISTAALFSAMALGASAVSYCENDADPKSSPKPPPTPARYSMIALGKPELLKLRKISRPRFPKVPNEAVIVVTLEPSQEQVNDWDDLLDEPVELKLIGVVEDDRCQVGLFESRHIHVQPAETAAFAIISQKSQLSKEDIAALVDKAVEARSKNGAEWQGQLPGRGAARLSLPKDEVIVSGTFCVDSKWSNGKCVHERENTCAFCKFMKAGPCRKEFIAWEKCVDIPNSDKEVNDFVDRCASETLILKACVDNNPEYYFVVADNEQDKETIERAKAKKAQEEEEKDRRTLDFLASYGT